MRIGLLSFEFPPETGFGGIGTYTYHQARALAGLGHDVHVLAGCTAPRPIAPEAVEGFTVWRGGQPRAARMLARLLGGRGLHWTGNRVETAATMLALLRHVTRRHALDVLEMPECGGEGMLINHLSRIPTVLRFHSPAAMIMPFYDVPPLDIRLCAMAERAGIAGARAYTACCAFLATEAARVFRLQRPVVSIPNGLDLALFDAARGALGAAGGPPIVLFSGRIERRKGADRLVEIVTPLLQEREVQVVVAGRDLFGLMEREIVPRLAAVQGRGVFRYLGPLPGPELRRWLQRAAVFLMPSAWEACPYACLEAMAAGLPVVGAAVGGVPELLRHNETGLLAPAGDASAFTREVGRLLDHPALARRMGAAARAAVQHSFTADRMARRSLDLYEQLARTR